MPRGLELTGGGGQVREESSRDSDNNIIVHFIHDAAPSESAKCWLYVDRLRTWDQEY